MAQPAEQDRTALGAEDREQQARSRFRQGISAYEERRYKDAIDAFLEAYRLYPNPTCAFNAAQAYDQLGDPAGALRFYREYLRLEPEAKDRMQVAERVSQLERALQDRGLQQVTVLSQPEGATLEIDGQPVGLTPWTGELRPGRHRARLSLAGHVTVAREFDLAAHRALEVPVTLEALPAPPPEQASHPARMAGSLLPGPMVSEARSTPSLPPAAEDRRVGPVTWAVLGLGAATLGAALVFEGLRRSSEEQVRTEPIQVERAEAFDTMEARQRNARILAGAGALLTVAGGVLVYLDLRPAEQKKQKTARQAPVFCWRQWCLASPGARF